MDHTIHFRRKNTVSNEPDIILTKGHTIPRIHSISAVDGEVVSFHSSDSPLRLMVTFWATELPKKAKGTDNENQLREQGVLAEWSAQIYSQR